MSTDFRPFTIKTLVANEENPITGWRALRAGGGMTYAFGRNAATRTALGAVDTATAVVEDLGGGVGVAYGTDYEVDKLDDVTGHVATAEGSDIERDMLDIVTGHAAEAEGENIEYSVRHADTPATALGENVRVVINAQATSAETLRSLNPSPATGDGSNQVFSYDSPFSALDYEETLKIVKVNGVAKTLTTDYTDDGDQIVFNADKIPANGHAVVIAGQALGTPVIEAARAVYAGKSVNRPDSSTTEVMKVVWENTPDEDLTLTTDYTIGGNGTTITLTAAGIDKLASGQNDRVEAEYDNDYWKLTKDIDTQVGASSPCVLSVEVDTVEKTVTTHYTVEAGVGITFTGGNIPTAGQTVELLHTWDNDKWLLTEEATTPVGSSVPEVITIEVDGVEKTGGGTHYTKTGLNIVFEAGSIPAASAVVEAFGKWNNDKWLMTGAAEVTPDGSSTVGVAVVEVDGTPATVVTDYAIVDGTSVIFESGSIPTAGQTVEIFGKYTNDLFTATLTTPPAADANNSDASLIVVKVDDVEQTLTTDYTTNGNGQITFEVGAMPTAAQVVTLFWRKLNNRFSHGGVDSGADETVTVWVEGTKKTVTTDYVVTGAYVDFTVGGNPAVDESVDFNVITANAVMIAGATLFFDTHKVNGWNWDHIIPTSAAVVEVM